MEQPKTDLSFARDLTSEILLRLPARSVMRFRRVSKLWSSISTDPYFINIFDTRSSTLDPMSLLLCFRKGDELFVSSIPQHHQLSKGPYPKPTNHYQMKRSENYYFPRESVHGLICFLESGTPIVWNPTKRHSLTLPNPRFISWSPSSYNITVFLGYDPIEDKHKVLCLPSCDPYMCRVLTLGSAQESWRTVKTSIHRSHIEPSGQCVKGVIYYVAYNYLMVDWVIISFDVRSEKFDVIQLASDNIPMQLPLGTLEDVLITYKGRLACLEENNGVRRLWVLEDAEKHKWSRQDFLVPLSHSDQRLSIDFKLTGFTHAGEFIYVPPMFHKSYYILFFDPVRNSFRRFEFGGIADEDCGLGNGFQKGLIYFPNHIESQISL